MAVSEVAWLTDLGGDIYQITAIPGQVKLGVKGVDEVLQNVWVLLRTPIGSSPLERDLGLPVNLLDQPIPTAMAILRDQIPKQVARWEERARVLRVDFSETSPAEALDGKLTPLVEVQILTTALEVD